MPHIWRPFRIPFLAKCRPGFRSFVNFPDVVAGDKRAFMLPSTGDLCFEQRPFKALHAWSKTHPFRAILWTGRRGARRGIESNLTDC